MIVKIEDGGLSFQILSVFKMHRKFEKKFNLCNINTLLLGHTLQVSGVTVCKIVSFHGWYNIKTTQLLTMIELCNEYSFKSKVILVKNAPLNPGMLGMGDKFLNLKIIVFLDINS